MNMIKTAIAAAAMAFAMNSGAAVAQTATTTTPSTTKPAVTTPSATTAPKAKIGTPKSEISVQCSKEADAKSLHGTERKKFRAKCKADAEKAAKAAAPAKKS